MKFFDYDKKFLLFIVIYRYLGQARTLLQFNCNLIFVLMLCIKCLWPTYSIRAADMLFPRLRQSYTVLEQSMF